MKTSQENVKNKCSLSFGKFCCQNFDKLIASAYTYISKINVKYYNNPYFIANPVLSNNTWTNNFLLKMAKFKYKNDNISESFSFVKLIKNIFIYYIKSILGIIFFMLHGIVYRISNLYKKNQYTSVKQYTNKEIIVFDTFTMIDRIYGSRQYNDSMFSDYYNCLSNEKKDFFIIAFLFGDRPYNLFRRWKTYNVLAKTKYNYITEFDIMNYLDYIKMFIFIIVYPFKMLVLLNNKIDKDIDKIFYEEIIESIKSKQFENYNRYLFGKSFGKLLLKNNNSLRLVSWFENQIIHKLLFLGIRESGCLSYIIGTQYYSYTNSLYHMQLDETKFNKKIAPDEILVKGKYFLKNSNNIIYRIGYAPREIYLNKIYINQKNMIDKNKIFIMLSYDIEEGKHILNILSPYDKELFIKLHPNHRLNNPFPINDKFRYCNNETNESIFGNSALIITGASGIALEAIASGCSVLIIQDNNKFPQYAIPSNHMGKEIIWDIAYSLEDVKICIPKLLNQRKENINKIIELARWYKENLFSYEFDCYENLGIKDG